MKTSSRFLTVATGLLFAGLPSTATMNAQQTIPPPPDTAMQQEQPPPVDNQPPIPGYADYGYKLDEYAAYNGYHDGYDKGMSDRNTGHSYRPTEDHIYNDPPGFKGGKYSRDEYKKVYREAFLRGYERGYRH